MNPPLEVTIIGAIPHCFNFLADFHLLQLCRRKQGCLNGCLGCLDMPFWVLGLDLKRNFHAGVLVCFQQLNLFRLYDGVKYEAKWVSAVS